MKKSLSLLLIAGLLFAEEPTLPLKKPRKKHRLREVPQKILAPARRVIEKYGTANPHVEEPASPVMPPHAPPMPPAPRRPLPPKPSWTDRFLTGAAKVMTTSWDDNIFVWLPAISTDPNVGPTYGLLPVLVLSEKVHHHIRHLLAPSYTHNSLFGQTATMRYYYYPTDESQLFATGSYSTETNRELKIRYQDTAFLEGRAFIRAEGYSSSDGSPRFFGVGPGTHSQDEAGYTAKDRGGRFAVGVNFLQSWRASGGLRYRRLGVDSNIVPEVSDLSKKFPDLPGLAIENTVAHEVRLLWDTRDFPVTPSRGSSGEFFFEKTNGAFGSDADFIRYGLEGKRFFLWRNPKQVTVVHGLYEWANGPQIPFYELPSLGGRETLRGFGDGRLADRGRLLFNLEQRVTVASLSLMGVQTQFEVAPFFDLGTVFPTLPQIRRKDLRPVYGLAFRAAVKPNVVGAVDVGIGKEGSAVFVGINYPF